MRELQPLRVQAEPLGRCPVEGVTHDGAVQSQRMGGVYAELVGASRLRIEGNEGAPVSSSFQDFIIGDGWFSMCQVCYLPGTVVRVGAQGEADASPVVGDQPVQQGDVPLADEALLELPLQASVCFLVLRDEQQAGCIHVQPVYSQGLGVARLHQGLDGGGGFLAGHGEEAGGLVYHQQGFVFVDDFQICAWSVSLA